MPMIYSGVSVIPFTYRLIDIYRTPVESLINNHWINKHWSISTIFIIIKIFIISIESSWESKPCIIGTHLIGVNCKLVNLIMIGGHIIKEAYELFFYINDI